MNLYKYLKGAITAVLTELPSDRREAVGTQTQEVPPQQKLMGSLPLLLMLGQRSPSANFYSQLTFQILSSCLPSSTQAGMMTNRSSLLDRKVTTPVWYKSPKCSIRISSSVFMKCLLVPDQTGA